MKTSLLLFSVLVFYIQPSVAQKIHSSDSTTVLPTDIYSNFPKQQYSNQKSTVYIINQSGKDSGKMKPVYYPEMIQMADQCYQLKDFIHAIHWYTSAFAANNDMGRVNDRLKTACCYAMLHNSDSAFIQLYRIAQKGNYTSLNELVTMEYLNSLHDDKRWQEIITLINKNRAAWQQKVNSEMNDKTLPQDNN